MIARWRGAEGRETREMVATGVLVKRYFNQTNKNTFISSPLVPYFVLRTSWNLNSRAHFSDLLKVAKSFASLEITSCIC